MTIKAQIFIQKLWQHNVEWDEPLTEEDQQQWLHIAHDNQEAMDVTISRQYFPKSGTFDQPHQLHIFADVSPLAYEAVAFLIVMHPLSWQNLELHLLNN